MYPIKEIIVQLIFIILVCKNGKGLKSPFRKSESDNSYCNPESKKNTQGMA